MTKVYLCGPMEGCAPGEAEGWREQAKRLMPDHEFLDPCRMDLRAADGHTPDDLCVSQVHRMVESNMRDIDRARFVLVFHPRPSTGTDMEVCYAGVMNWRVDAAHRARIVAVVPPGARLHPWLRYFAEAMFEEVRDACAWIIKESKP